MGLRFETPPPEPLASALGFLLSWNGQRTAFKFAQALEPLGLRPPQFGLLRLIDAQPGSTQQELVARSQIDPSSMVAVLDELEEMGLVERREHSGDRRKHAVHLTAKGQRKLKGAMEAGIGMAKELFSPLDSKEQETLTKLLRKLAGVDA